MHLLNLINFSCTKQNHSRMLFLNFSNINFNGCLLFLKKYILFKKKYNYFYNKSILNFFQLIKIF